LILGITIIILFVTVTVSCRKDDVITLNETSLFLEYRDTVTLIATVHPNQNSNKKVIWRSSDTNIVTVTPDGLVTAISNGVATITASVQNKKQTATCLVTVTDYREKWIGYWDFVQKNFSFDFGSVSWDTTYYLGKISLGKTSYTLTIEYSENSSIVMSVSKDGSLFYDVRHTGGFAENNRVYLRFSGGSMNGTTKWTKDIEGVKKEESKKIVIK